MRIGYGPLARVLASPRFPHGHHDRDWTRPRSSASLFPWLDVLFGSYDLLDGCPARYGSDEPVGRGFVASSCRRSCRAHLASC